MTNASSAHAREPMRLMKAPKPGTNIAASAAHSTMAARMQRKARHLAWCGKRSRNQPCDAINLGVSLFVRCKLHGQGCVSPRTGAKSGS